MKVFREGEIYIELWAYDTCREKQSPGRFPCLEQMGEVPLVHNKHVYFAL